jgi:hypothetical protein
MWSRGHILLGVHWKKLYLGKKIVGNLNFCPAVVANTSLNASPGSALDVLCYFSLCANFGSKTLAPIMTSLPRIWTPNT